MEHAIHSHLDSQRFGVDIARLVAESPDQVAAALGAVDPRTAMVVIRCDARDGSTVRTVEDLGGRLMDTVVTMTTPLPKDLPPPDPRVRPATASEARRVARVARRAFEGYVGHYHADPRLPDDRCDAAYADWAHRSCRATDSRSVVLVAEIEDAGVAGLSTCRLEDDVAVGGLDGVAPEHRRHGLYRALNLERMRWATVRGARRLRVDTHAANLPALRGLSELGFVARRVQHTFHLWRTPPEEQA